MAKLRDAKRDASDGTVEALKKMVVAIRKRFGVKARIIVRADSGFAREEIMAWCDRRGMLYEKFYCARGEMENRIKEAQQDLFADRTSTHWMASNQLRLWFSAFAHLMLSVLRADVLHGTQLAQATVGQIRLKLFKIAARVKISCRRIHLELASAYPYRKTFRQAWATLSALPDG